jgi:hypothetical protein
VAVDQRRCRCRWVLLGVFLGPPTPFRHRRPASRPSGSFGRVLGVVLASRPFVVVPPGCASAVGLHPFPNSLINVCPLHPKTPPFSKRVFHSSRSRAQSYCSSSSSFSLAAGARALFVLARGRCSSVLRSRSQPVLEHSGPAASLRNLPADDQLPPMVAAQARGRAALRSPRSRR